MESMSAYEHLQSMCNTFDELMKKNKVEIVYERVGPVPALKQLCFLSIFPEKRIYNLIIQLPKSLQDEAFAFLNVAHLYIFQYGVRYIFYHPHLENHQISFADGLCEKRKFVCKYFGYNNTFPRKWSIVTIGEDNNYDCERRWNFDCETDFHRFDCNELINVANKDFEAFFRWYKMNRLGDFRDQVNLVENKDAGIYLLYNHYLCFDLRDDMN